MDRIEKIRNACAKDPWGVLLVRDGLILLTEIDRLRKENEEMRFEKAKGVER